MAIRIPRRPLAITSALCFTVIMCFAVDAIAADSYPSRPIRLIVPYGAGGSYDLLARVVAQQLSSQIGQQIVIDDRPGAAGRIGMGLAVKSTPDGYTALVIGNTQVIASVVYEKVPYNLDRDIIPLTTTATITNTLVTFPGFPADSIADLIAYTKSHPGKVLFGSGGTGGITHLAGEWFNSMSGTKITHVPYKSGVLANSAVMGGEVQMVFLNAYGCLPLLEGNKIRVLAVTGLQRSRFFPGIPTLDEEGLKGYDLQEFHGFALPAGTPEAIVNRLHAEISKALSSTEVKGKFTSQAAELTGSTPEAFRSLLRAEHDKYRRIVKAVGIKPE